ncbi:MAG: lactonase family protein [Bacteroidota bacterium]|nr:lactonase family protein [Bacteroidota bacterium]
MQTVFVGTYTEKLDHVNGSGEGIYVFTLEAGRLRPIGVYGGLANPSFLHVTHSRLYAVSEVMQYDGQAQGGAQSFAIDPGSKRLMPLNVRPVPGQAPCYISLHRNHVLIANYMGGSVTAIRLDASGRLAGMTSHIQHSGSGPNRTRQEAPHPHAIVPLPSGEQVLVPDLGTDQVRRYGLEAQTGKLTDLGAPAQVQPGAGPRHLAISPAGHCVYLMNELDSTITAFALEPNGLRALQTISALPDSFDGVPSGADIHVHPSGRFLYASLRGPHSLVCFRVDAATGHLTNPQWTSTLGLTPRNFALDAAGETLIAANQDSDSLVAYQVDLATGHLEGPTDTADVPSPACVVIAP